MAKKSSLKKSKRTSPKSSLHQASHASTSNKISHTKNNYSFLKRARGFGELMRPLEWSKPLMNMSLALLMAFYVYNAITGVFTIGTTLGLFILGFISVALLWSGLYALNDYTDWKIDALHEVKKKRAIPSGRVTPAQALVFAILLILISFGIAFALNNALLAICLFAMMINQFVYTFKPFRLKERKGFDLLSGSMINPIFRYLSGLALFVPIPFLLAVDFPLLPFIFVIALQLGGFTLYRLGSKDHDLKVKMKSTVASVPEKIVKNGAYVVVVIGAAAYVLLFIGNYFFPTAKLGYIPLQYIFPIILAVIVSPAIKNYLTNPSKKEMAKAYKGLYASTFVFALANIAIFLLVP